MSKIITERLIMRPFTGADINYLIHLKGSATNMAKTTVGVIDALAAARQLDQYQNQWATRGIGVWSLTHKTSGAFVGECGFVARDDMDELSLRYTLCHGWWGQGLGLEAVRAALDHGLGKGGLAQISAVVLESNSRSCRILEQAGMQQVETNYAGIPGFRRYQIAKQQGSALAV